MILEELDDAKLKKLSIEHLVCEGDFFHWRCKHCDTLIDMTPGFSGTPVNVLKAAMDALFVKTIKIARTKSIVPP